MDCKASSALMNDYIEKNLDLRQQADLLEHASGCEACDDELQVLLELNDLLGKLEFFEPRGNFVERVMDSIDHSLYLETPIKRRILQPMLISIAIYISILLGVSPGSESTFLQWLAIPSAAQQLPWINYFAEKLLIRPLLGLFYTKDILQLLLNLFLDISFGSAAIYGLGLALLTALFIIINTALLNILKN
jgi:hypothetical protein